jgi:hypothetical protein
MASDPAARARHLVDVPDAPLPGALDAPDRRALGWALKDAAYAAWSRAPAEAGVAAQRLAALQAQAPGDRELAAVAAWTSGIAALADGRMADAVTALAGAEAGFAAIGAAQHAAETRVPRIAALAMLGREDEALACAEAARSAFLGTGDERAAGKVELNLGTMHSRGDRHADAARWFRSAAVRFARVGDTEHSVMADISLAYALTWLGDFDEALRIDQRARMRAETHGFAVLRAHAHGAIGRIELNRGHVAAALRELAAASRMLAEAGAGPQRCIEAESTLADAYLAVNLLPEAVAVYDRVVAQATALESPTELARALLDRARTQLRLGAREAALAGLAQARTLFTQQGNAASAAAADVLEAAARLAGGEVAAALDRACAAEAALAGSGVVGWWLEARTQVAAARAAAGEGAAAEADFAALLRDGAALLPIALAAHRGLGALAWQRGDAATARRHLRAALDQVDTLRRALPGDEFRAAVAADAEGAHDLLVEIACADGSDGAALLEEIERGRARALALAIGEPPQDETPAVQAARTRLQWARSRRAEAAAEGDAALLAERDGDVAAQEAALLEAARRSLLDGVATAAASPGAAAALRCAELQAALAPGEALVSFHRRGDRWCAAVATRDRVERVEAACPGLDARLEGLRFQIDALRFGGQALAAHGPLLLRRAQAHLQALHALVWQPLAAALDGIERVTLLPHGALHYVPFAALHDGTGWLVERLEIGVAPGAAAWLAGRTRAAPRGNGALVVGVGGATLPHVAAEVDAVAAIFGAGARVLRGADATAAALQAAVDGVDVLHLACHGRFRADNPAFSAIELADGPLALHDARRLPLAGAAPVVVLSACETGLSRIAPGDELLGLVRGFLAAGARTVVASAWAVDDAATAGLMGRFHAALASGQRPAAALRAAQRALAAAGEHPFRWAAFSLYGQG